MTVLAKKRDSRERSSQLVRCNVGDFRALSTERGYLLIRPALLKFRFRGGLMATTLGVSL